MWCSEFSVNLVDFICGESNPPFFRVVTAQLDMVASLGERKCAMGYHTIVGKVHLVPLLDEDSFEDPMVAPTGPCCNKHYLQFFYKRKRNQPLVYTLCT